MNRSAGQKHSRYRTPEPFAQLTLALFGSIALTAASLAARRTLDRLIAEHLKHGGKENGRLAVSYAQLAIHAGVQEREIAGALAELVDLGLVIISRRGQRPNGAAKTRPNLYRLTFLPDYEGGWPSDEWQRYDASIGTVSKAWSVALARAKRIAHAARKRRQDGKPPLRSEAEADATIAPVESVLKHLGKGNKIGRPGNKQTRAALVEHNHFPRDESPPTTV
jgi:hypothetical protein